MEFDVVRNFVVLQVSLQEKEQSTKLRTFHNTDGLVGSAISNGTNKLDTTHLVVSNYEFNDMPMHFLNRVC
jgi:hypothetical protein